MTKQTEDSGPGGSVLSDGLGRTRPDQDEHHMQPIGVETRPGHKRKIVNGRVEICHRLTAQGVQPERWTVWEVWGDFHDDKIAELAHDWALTNGPWGNPYIPSNVALSGAPQMMTKRTCLEAVGSNAELAAEAKGNSDG